MSGAQTVLGTDSSAGSAFFTLFIILSTTLNARQRSSGRGAWAIHGRTLPAVKKPQWITIRYKVLLKCGPTGSCDVMMRMSQYHATRHGVGSPTAAAIAITAVNLYTLFSKKCPFMTCRRFAHFMLDCRAVHPHCISVPYQPRSVTRAAQTNGLP
jgi:hypothetical protein